MQQQRFVDRPDLRVILTRNLLSSEALNNLEGELTKIVEYKFREKFPMRVPRFANEGQIPRRHYFQFLDANSLDELLKSYADYLRLSGIDLISADVIANIQKDQSLNYNGPGFFFIIGGANLELEGNISIDMNSNDLLSIRGNKITFKVNANQGSEICIIRLNELQNYSEAQRITTFQIPLLSPISDINVVPSDELKNIAVRFGIETNRKKLKSKTELENYLTRIMGRQFFRIRGSNHYEPIQMSKIPLRDISRSLHFHAVRPQYFNDLRESDIKIISIYYFILFPPNLNLKQKQLLVKLILGRSRIRSDWWFPNETRAYLNFTTSNLFPKASLVNSPIDLRYLDPNTIQDLDPPTLSFYST